MPTNMSGTLNVNAQPFVPTRASAPVAIPRASDARVDLPDDPFDLSNASEVALSPAELEEIETVERWVMMQAELEEEEIEHSIALALRYGDKSRIAEIKQRTAAHKSKHGKKGGVHKPGKLQSRAQ